MEKYESYSKASVDKIERYIKGGFNVLLEGKHGVGKTEMVRQACENLGYNVLVFNAALMDSFVDFRGVPFSSKNEQGKEVLRMVRQEGKLEQADVIFFDEIGRAQISELNAIMNTINEHAVNGEKLENLKSVVGATNTGRGYSSFELDPAQKDRFDVFFSCSPKASKEYFNSIFGEKMGDALTKWQHSIINDINSNVAAKDMWDNYVSPRTLEKIGHMFLEFKDIDCIKDALGDLQTQLDINSLFKSLKDSNKTVDEIYQSMSGLGVPDIMQQITWMIPSIVQNQDEHINVISNITDEDLQNNIKRSYRFLQSRKKTTKARTKVDSSDLDAFIKFSKKVAEL